MITLKNEERKINQKETKNIILDYNTHTPTRIQIDDQ